MIKIEIKKAVDVRGLSPPERQKIVREESENLKPGEIIEVISDDERMPKLAPKIAQAIGTIEHIDVKKKEDGLYHGYFRRINLVSLIKAIGTVKIARIDGGMEVKNKLKNMSIRIGDVIEVHKRGITHPHFGPLIVRTEKDVLIPRGIADKIFVNGKRLLNIEKGKVKITSLKELSGEMRNSLSKIGIEEGKEIEVKGHDVEKTYKFKIDNDSYTLGDGETAKILVKSGEKLIQANFLKNEGIIEEIIAGTEVYDRLGDITGKKIKIISVEEKKAHADLGQFVILKVGDKEISLGRGLAEKIWVKKVGE